MSDEIQSILPLSIETDTETEAKPKKRAVAKKAARKKATPAPAVEAASAPEPSEPAPAPKAKRTRKIAAAPVPVQTEAPEPAPAAASNGEAPPPAKPRRSPVRRKSAGEPQEPPAEKTASPPPAPEIKAEPAPVASTAPAPAAPPPRDPAPSAATPPPPAARGASNEGSSEETGSEENSRTRRWKERRNRFKKWKERRRSSNTSPGAQSDENGENTENSGGSSSAQGADTPQPPALLGPPEPVDGILELTPKGYGFLRQKSRSYAPIPQDPFVSPELIRQFGLREGMAVKGQACKAQRGPQVTEISEVNDRAPEAMRDLPLFEELKAINPNKRVQLETDKNRLTTRVIDMITPVGRGQRGLIVAPPRTGKTTLLQHIAEAVTANHPGMHLMLLLVDERPEEVTEFKRVLPNAEIFASSNDQDIKSHTRIAQFAIERAKRLVECGEHVFILLDSITRLARAFNNAKQGGATMSGGVGVGALEIPRRLFAAARNTREAGSLTVMATALIETGSRMDDLIFQEFKGTGNLELVLDRKISEQFYYPAVNIFKSGTRREELLLQSFQLDKIHMLRRGLAGHKPIEALQRVLSLLERYPSNAQMLVDLPSKG